MAYSRVRSHIVRVTALAFLAAAPFDDAAVERARRDESALIEKLRASDEHALETVFHARAATLMRFAERLGATRAVAEEIVADVFAEVWNGRERLDPTKSLDAYLFRAVRNNTFNARRGERRESARTEREYRLGERPGLGADTLPADHAIDHAMAAELVWNAVRDLPERQRTVLYLRYTRELSLADVAETMGTSVPGVKNLLQRAHHTLRTTLGGVFEDL
jgi:RNA polymerase sigma factor (sigma-70 family)